MKKVLKEGLKYIAIYFIMIAIFITSLALVDLIPKDTMKENVKQTADILMEQTNKWRLNIRFIPITFDNYTDALMINTAYSIDSKTPLYSAMVARKNYIPGKTKTIMEDTSGELVSSSKYEELDQVGDLNDTVNEDTEESFEYARYWHGYLLWLRPALCLGNINVIRIALTVIFIALAVALIAIICTKIRISYGILIRFTDYFA